MSKGALQLGRGLAMGADRGRALGGQRRVLEDGPAVAGSLGVVGQAGGIRARAAVREEPQRPPVQVDRALRRQRFLDRRPRDLVAEPHGAPGGLQHPRRQTLVERPDLVARDGLEQRDLRLGGDDRDGFEQRSTLRIQTREARQDGVAHGLGNLLAGREHLADEKRVAVGAPVEGLRVEFRVRGQPFDSTGGERFDSLPRDRPRRRQLADRKPQRVHAVELVLAVGDHHERAQLRDPPAGVAEEVKRRPVGPVQILENQDHGWAALERCAEALE